MSFKGGHAFDYNSAAKKHPEFSKDQIEAFHAAFVAFDTDKSNHIDVHELSNALAKAGVTAPPKATLQKHIDEVDTDKSGNIEWEEFLQIMKNLMYSKDGASAFAQHVQAANKTVQKVVSTTGATHSFSDEERVSFVEHINSALKSNPICTGKLPINPTNKDLFTAVGDGKILCALINHSVPDTIDMRAVNKDRLNAFSMTENLNLAINSAKAIGCTVVNVGAQDILEGSNHLILGLLWQIIRAGLVAQVTLSNHPELFRLLEQGETLADLAKLTPEQMLLRWFNYHLKAAGHARRVRNFGGDISDSECYTVLLHQLAPHKCDTAALRESDLTKRATKVLENAAKLDANRFVKPDDIVKGNPKLNFAFVANLFNLHPGLEPLSEAEKSKLDEWLFASEGTREARAFMLWINSLGIEPFVHNLFEDLQDGIVILKVMDVVQPGIVDWSKVNQKAPLNKFKKVENCNYAVVLGKQMKFSLVGVGGSDLVDGNQTLTLALVWQLMRAHVLAILNSLGPYGDEAKMLKWANEKVKASGKTSKLESFKDSSARTSHFFLDLLNAIRNNVDYSLVTPGETDADATQNAKYTLSIARKIGCTIFLLPEDIVEVKSKMLLTLLGSIVAQGLRG